MYHSHKIQKKNKDWTFNMQKKKAQKNSRYELKQKNTQSCFFTAWRF